MSLERSNSIELSAPLNSPDAADPAVIIVVPAEPLQQQPLPIQAAPIENLPEGACSSLYHLGSKIVKLGLIGTAVYGTYAMFKGNAWNPPAPISCEYKDPVGMFTCPSLASNIPSVIANSGATTKGITLGRMNCNPNNPAPDSDRYCHTDVANYRYWSFSQNIEGYECGFDYVLGKDASHATSRLNAFIDTGLLKGYLESGKACVSLVDDRDYCRYSHPNVFSSKDTNYIVSDELITLQCRKIATPPKNILYPKQGRYALGLFKEIANARDEHSKMEDVKPQPQMTP